MQLKRLRETQDKLAWPSDSNDLPVVNWESCTFFQFLSLTRSSRTPRPITGHQPSRNPHLRLYSRRVDVHGGAPRRSTPYSQVHRQGCHDGLFRRGIRPLQCRTQRLSLPFVLPDPRIYLYNLCSCWQCSASASCMVGRPMSSTKRPSHPRSASRSRGTVSLPPAQVTLTARRGCSARIDNVAY